MKIDYYRKNILISLISEYAYIEKKITLPSGKESSYYINCKKLLSFPKNTMVVGDLLWVALRDYDPDAVGAIELRAVTLLGLINYFGYRTFIIRKEKDHEINSEIEGAIMESDKRVVILEDVITTGRTVLNAIAKLKKKYPNIEEIKVISIFDKQEGVKRITEKGYLAESLVTAIELFRHNRKK